MSFGNFTGVTYYDGQGSWCKRSRSFRARAQRRVDLHPDRHHDRAQFADYFRANNMKYEVIAFATADETIKAYEIRPLRRLHHRCLAALLGEAQAPERQRSRHPARSSPRSRSAAGAQTISGSTSSSGRCSPCSMPRSSGLPERRRGHRIEPAGSGGCWASRQFRRAARPHQGLGGAHRQAGGQLRRDVRAQRWERLEARHQPPALTGSGPRAASSTQPPIR